MHSTPPLSVMAAIIALCASQFVYAQYTTSATCSASFDWAVNEQRQSPCLVAAYVQGACGATGKWEVPALPNPQVFYNPPLQPMSECGCSIANYNLLAACTACQEASPPRFPFWIANCSAAGLLDTSTYYPTSKWPLSNGVTIPLWAQQDARLWANQQFNSTQAEEIAASGILIGAPLGSSSTTSATSTISTSSESPSSTTSPPSAATSSASNEGSRTDIGPIVGGAVGGVLGLLLIGVLFWWIVRQRQPFEEASPSMSTVPFTHSTNPTPALVKMAVPVAQRPPPTSYPSYMSSPAMTSHGTDSTDLGHSNPVIALQNAPGALDRSRTLGSNPYATAGVGLTFSAPPMSSSTSVGSPPDTPQRAGSSSSRSMIARFVFPRRRNKRHSNATSMMSQDSSRMSQIGVLQSPAVNAGYLPGPSSGPDQAALEPTPYILPPQPYGLDPSPGDSTSHLSVPTKGRINPPGYTLPEAAIPSPLPQPNPAVQAHMALPLNTDLNRMMTATPALMSPEMPNPPSYLASQAESQEDRLRRASSVATAVTRASSNVLPTPSTPERRPDPLPPVPERAGSPQEPGYPREKV